MRMLNKAIVLILVSIITLVMVFGVTSAPVQPQAPEKGPPLDEILMDVRLSQDVGIGDVATGKIDVFLWSAAKSVFDRLPDEIKEAIKLIPTKSGYNDIVFSPYQSYNDTGHPNAGPWILDLPSGVVNSTTGQIYFNPFGIRDVRYGLQWLFDKKFIVEQVYAGGGEPMHGPVMPSMVAADSQLQQVYDDLGLTGTGDEATALAMIDAALTAVIPELQAKGYDLYKKTDAASPAGYWWTFVKPGPIEMSVELKFFIRIEDERLQIGRYVADQLEKAGIKIDRREVSRALCIPAIYLTDPRDWEDAAQIYTEGWVLMSDWPYREWGVCQMYAAWAYRYNPGVIGWQYTNDTIEELTQKLCLGQVIGPEGYWDTMRTVVKMGIQESFRVFLINTWEYFAVNPRVTNMAYGIVSGLWPAWPFRTATTPDDTLKIAQYSAAGQLFMSAWNPIGGFDDVYSELCWRYVTDYADYPHPMTGEPIPLRATWTVDTDYDFDAGGNIIGNINVPSTALNYSAYTDTWYQLGAGGTAAAEVTYNYMWSNWHHHMPMNMTDLLYSWGWAYEWATEDYPGDPYYDIDYADATAPILEMVKGIVINNDTSITVYGDYVHPASLNVTADYYAFWPWGPWELREAMDYLIVNGGPVSADPYSWDGDPGTEWIDMIAPAQQPDFVEALKILRAGGHVMNYTNGTPYTPTTDEIDRHYVAALDWATLYGHVCISNGPYYVGLYDPERMYIEFEAFRDPTYPFTPDYWQKKLFLERLEIEKIEAPGVADLGADIEIDVYPTLIREYPEPTVEPATKGYIDVKLKDVIGAVVYTGAASYVEPGLYSITTPGSATATLSEGSYTIEATAAIYPGVYPDIKTREIVLFAPPPTMYSLTISVYPAAGGTTDPAAGVYTYAEGTDAIVTLTLSTGYEVDYWELDGAEWTAAGKNTTVTVTMDKLHNLRGYVKVKPGVPTYDLTIGISPAEGGATDPITGVHTYAVGTAVTVTITIAEGYELDYWELDGAEWTAAGKETTVTVTMDKAHNLRAYVKAIAPWLPTELAIGIVAIIIAVVAIGVAVILWRRKPA